jgi:hypothetical protein
MLAALLLIAATVQSTEVTEPNTNVKFPVELQSPAGTQVFTGAGVRTRTMLQVKVYAFGLYVDPAGARSALAAWRGKSAGDLAKDKAVYQALLKGQFPMTLRLVMTRDVGGDQMASAFEEALFPRINRAAQNGKPGGAEALARFRNFFSSDLKSGTELVFSWATPGTLHVFIGGQHAGQIENEALCWALFDVYLGDKPISENGKKSVVSRLPEILTHP